MTIQDYYKYSQLSSLAYVDWSDSSVGLDKIPNLAATQAIKDANSAGRMPGESAGDIDTLGEKFFMQDGWRIADFQPNDNAGFKASLFTNAATGEKVLGIAGTEPDVNPYLDLIKADFKEIGDYGMAISQAVSLFNYIQCLQAPQGSTDVLQLELIIDYVVPPSGDYVTVGLVPPRYLSVVASQTGAGLGLLSPADNVTITGHSLGGHLAALGQRLFPELFDDTVTYNAPGFDPNLGVSLWPDSISSVISLGNKLTDEFIDTFFKPYLTTPPLSDFGNVSVMVSEDSAPGNDGSGVSSTWITGTQAGPQQSVTTEQNSHMIEPFMDSLAVQVLLEKLNPEIGLVGAGELIQAASKDAGKSEEVLLDALSELLIDDPRPKLAKNPNDIADGLDFWINAGNFLKRTEIHNRIIELETAIDDQNLTLTSLVNLSQSDIETQALNNIAYRYALVNLNPFAVVGANDLYDSFNLNGELDIFDPVTGDGQLSNMYLADRAEMLANLIYCNIHDTTDAGGDGSPILYTDIRAGAENLSISAGDRQILLDQARYTSSLFTNAATGEKARFMEVADAA
jgi:hypothetical protein